MRLLLDTHALLWALSEPEKLSAAARTEVEDTANEVWVSSVSLFEIATKVRLGKLKHPGVLLTRHRWTLARLGARLLPLGGGESLLAGSMPVLHRDPFDRLLAAQALRKKLRLVSSDAAFAQFSGLDVLW